MKAERCWTTIGCWGREEPRCEKLAEVVHCRNCEVYIGAGRRLLQRPMPEGHYQELAERLLAPRKAQPTAESVLVFRLGQEYLALPTVTMEKVLSPRPIHSVPHRSNSVFRGLINLDGRLEPCVSLEALLGLPLGGERPGSRMLVIRVQGERFAFTVDQVLSTYRPPQDSLRPIFEALASEQHQVYLEQIFSFQNQMVGWLDAIRVAESLERSLGRTAR